MSHIISALVLSLVCVCAPVTNDNGIKKLKWRHIILMRSTRDDVERLLGRSKYRGYSASYKVEDGTLQVEYYPFNFCESQPGAYLRVPQWTVVEITHVPDSPPKFANLKLDLKKFRKVRESVHAPELISYVNADKELNDIRYFPGRRFDYLRCKKTQ